MMKPKYRIKLYRDSLPESPREWDNLGTMVCSHDRYELGDEQVNGSSEMDDYLMALLPNNQGVKFVDKWGHALDMAGVGLPYGSSQHLRSCDDVDRMFREELMSRLQRYYIIMPLYLYDHGGITISTGKFSCAWDSGLLGFIYVSRDKVRKESGWKQLTAKRVEKIESYLKGEVDVYDHYLQGLVWGYEVQKGTLIEETFDPDDEDNWQWEEEDSCWGFYGWEKDVVPHIYDHISHEYGITEEYIAEAYNDAIG